MSNAPLEVPKSVHGVQGNNSIDDCIRTLYGVDSLPASAAKIAAEVDRQPAGQPVILVGHNGPTGLGKRRHDPCGKDFVSNAGAIVL